MPIYDLYLSTLITDPTFNKIIPINKTNLASVTWNIDFDNLFRNNQNKYKNCRLRFRLNSVSWAAGVNDWENFSGYLSCNLLSNYSAPYVNGTLIGVLFPQNILTGGSTYHCYHITTMDNTTGCELNIPYGNQNLTIQFYNDDTLTLMSNIPEYAIQLSFELYNEI